MTRPTKISVLSVLGIAVLIYMEALLEMETAQKEKKYYPHPYLTEGRGGPRGGTVSLRAYFWVKYSEVFKCLTGVNLGLSKLLAADSHGHSWLCCSCLQWSMRRLSDSICFSLPWSERQRVDVSSTVRVPNVLACATQGSRELCSRRLAFIALTPGICMLCMKLQPICSVSTGSKQHQHQAPELSICLSFPKAFKQQKWASLYTPF